MANRVLSDVKAVLCFAVDEEHIDASPAGTFTRKRVGGREKSRDRNLSFAVIGMLVVAVVKQIV